MHGFNVESELLDNKIEKYVIKWKEGITPKVKAEIQKTDGTKIGKIKTDGLIHKKTSLLDIDDSLVLTTNKFGLTGNKYEVKNSIGNRIGIVSSGGITFAPDVFMKNPEGEKILTVELSINPRSLTSNDASHEINAIDGKNVAKFGRKVEKLNQSTLLKTIFGLGTVYGKTYILQINDLDFDRKFLLGFFISVLVNEFGVDSGAVSSPI